MKNHRPDKLTRKAHALNALVAEIEHSAGREEFDFAFHLIRLLQASRELAVLATSGIPSEPADHPREGIGWRSSTAERIKRLRCAARWGSNRCGLRGVRPWHDG
ncbi:hypothetical protein [Streptomyces sp. TBY4]|uniref:hypothetical protein n=1 Tax=Streptomyces sp. TBY4 TaxID=2962030 RepID=UPI0020B8B931|nr:hypothetical protein [Streptomyces sp. TBY4]